MLESEDDQWRTPLIFGNLDASCCVAGELSVSGVSEVALVNAEAAGVAVLGDDEELLAAGVPGSVAGSL